MQLDSTEIDYYFDVYFDRQELVLGRYISFLSIQWTRELLSPISIQMAAGIVLAKVHLSRYIFSGLILFSSWEPKES